MEVGTNGKGGKAGSVREERLASRSTQSASQKVEEKRTLSPALGWLALPFTSAKSALTLLHPPHLNQFCNWFLSQRCIW